MAGRVFSITANGQSTPDLGAPQDKDGGVVIEILGTWTGTLQFEASVGKATWVPLAAQKVDGSAAATSTTGNGLFRIQGGSAGWGGGLNSVRVSSIAAWTGTALIQAQPFVST